MKRVRRTAHMRNSGPNQVTSHYDGTLVLSPAWPQLRPYNTEAGG